MSEKRCEVILEKSIAACILKSERMTRFIYDHMDRISNIAVSIDTHTPHQIFHPCWWIDEKGKHPAPYTVITLADLDAGKWRAVINPQASREYVRHLEQDARKALCIWTYHCLQGTTGAALENQFANMVYFHSVARKAVVQRLVKGQDPMSEMYGIIKPEYDTKGYINLDFLNKLERFDKVIIAGEAKSHCVLESIRQILEHYQTSPEVTKKVYILEDCMSSIPGYEDVTEQTFEDFKKILCKFSKEYRQYLLRGKMRNLKQHRTEQCPEGIQDAEASGNASRSGALRGKMRNLNRRKNMGNGMMIDGLDEIELKNTSIDDIDSENINLMFLGIDQSGSMAIYNRDMKHAF